MLKVLANIGIVWWGVFGVLLTLLGIAAGVLTQSTLYYFLAGIALAITFLIILYSQSRQLANQAKTIEALQSSPVDFDVRETKPTYLNVHSFFGQVGGTGRFEIIVPSEIINKTPNPMTLVCEGVVDTDLPITENQSQKLVFGSTGQNTLKLQGGHIEPASMRMEIQFNLEPAEKCLAKIANASYLHLKVTVRQNDGKSFQRVYKIPEPQNQMVASFEKSLVDNYNSTGFKHVKGETILEHLKYLWKVSKA